MKKVIEDKLSSEKKSDMKKRICIFVFYDKDGIVDDYVRYLLSELKKVISELVILVNGNIRKEEKSKLKDFSPEVYYRDNSGLDAGAFKEALTDLVGWKHLQNYDSLLLVNDTFYGPFFPFSKMFDEMDGRGLDFWGITESYPTLTWKARNKTGIYNKHLQTYFLVIQKRMFLDQRFMDYWDNLPVYSDFENVVANHESRFTSVFESYGFRSGAYVDTSFTQKDDPEFNINPYAMLPSHLIEYEHCPILKRKIFSIGEEIYLGQSNQLECINAINYIEKNTAYDTDMIYRNLARVYSRRDLESNLGLNFYQLKNNRFTFSRDESSFELIVLVNDPYFLKVIFRHIEGISGKIKIITSDKVIIEKIQTLNKDNIQLLSGQDEYQLLVKALATDGSLFEYLGVLNTLIYNARFYSYSLECLEKDLRLLFDNEERINSIINEFNSHNYLGFFFSSVFGKMKKINVTKSERNELQKILQIRSNEIEEANAYYFPSAFWFRTIMISYKNNKYDLIKWSWLDIVIILIAESIRNSYIGYTLTDYEDLVYSRMLFSTKNSKNPLYKEVSVRIFLLNKVKTHISMETKKKIKKYTPAFILKMLEKQSH